MARKFKRIEIGEVIGDMYVYAEEQDIKNNRRMLNCRCIKCNREKQIYEGNLRDRPNCSKHEVACGFGLKKSVDPKFYDVWAHMKDRIYNPNNEFYNRYGERGLTTDYNAFVDFLDDEYAKYLQAKAMYPGCKISLDRIDNNLGYIRGNLRWTTPSKQVRNSTIVREFYAISPTGVIYLTNNQTQFALRHGLEPKHISDCLLGKQATTGGGWQFVEKNPLFINLYFEQVAIKELYY